MKNLKVCFISVAVITASCFMAVSANAQSTKLSDPEIASVALTANQIDVDYATIALKKSKNTEILNFAKTMQADHNATIEAAKKLAGKLHVTPKDNAMSKSLKEGAEKTSKMLASKSGNAFNKAYVDNEVAYHKAVIDAIDKVLIPQTQNAELKAFLENVMPVLRTHLGHAEMLQKNMK